jgi:formate-dependent nitrite reductase membrane component NrfD
VIASRATLPTELWILLIAGFVVCIAFTYLFQMESLATQAFSVGAIASLIGFVLFVIFALQHPFAGDVQISDEPFRHVLSDWRGQAL